MLKLFSLLIFTGFEPQITRWQSMDANRLAKVYPIINQGAYSTELLWRDESRASFYAHASTSMWNLWTHP